MANTDIFTRAKAYRKQHPRTAWTDCVKAVAGKKTAVKKKTATVGRVKHKKAEPAKVAPRKIKVKIKPAKKGSSSITISGIHLAKTKTELAHQHGLVTALNRHKTLLKTKGLSAGEKQQIRKDIASYTKAIKTSKQHVTALKRSI